MALRPRRHLRAHPMVHDAETFRQTDAASAATRPEVRNPGTPGDSQRLHEERSTSLVVCLTYFINLFREIPDSLFVTLEVSFYLVFFRVPGDSYRKRVRSVVVSLIIRVMSIKRCVKRTWAKLRQLVLGF